MQNEAGCVFNMGLMRPNGKLEHEFGKSPYLIPQPFFDYLGVTLYNTYIRRDHVSNEASLKNSLACMLTRRLAARTPYS